MGNLLSISADAKTRKGESAGYLTGVMYLSPASSGGFGNLCANASPGCIAACLETTRGVKACAVSDAPRSWSRAGNGYQRGPLPAVYQVCASARVGAGVSPEMDGRRGPRSPFTFTHGVEE